MKPLFPETIPILPIDKEVENKLKKLKDQFPAFDDYYVVSAAVEERRVFFEELWCRYEPFADANFVEQSQKSFHQKTWEMYLGNVFLEKEHILESAGENAPDLKIMTNSPTAWVECVAPQKGDGVDRVPDMVYGVVEHVPEEQIKLRIAASFEEKSNKFKKYIDDGVVKRDQPRIIAINGGGLGFTIEGEPPRVIAVLFAIGHLTLHFNPGHTEVVHTSFSRIDKVVKQSQAEVILGQFLSDKYKHISAVIYSKDAVLNRPLQIGTECVVVHNPFAEVPLPIDSFSFMTRFVSKEGAVHKIIPEGGEVD